MISKKEIHNDYLFLIITEPGLSHKMANVNNQDAATFNFIEGDYVLAISDGVGSCINAGYGANAAVKAVENTFINIREKSSDINPHEIIKLIIQEWFRLLQGYIPDECCSTLKAVIKLKNTLILFSIGDGFIAFSAENKCYISPLERDFFVNQTHCLNKNVSEMDFWCSSYDLTSSMNYVVFACTDGIANGIQEGKEIELVTEVDQNISKDDLLDEVKSIFVEISEYCSDDKTVGIVKYEGKDAKSSR